MDIAEMIWQMYVRFGWVLLAGISSYFLYRLCVLFVRPRAKRRWKLLLATALGGSSSMVIWIGDPNLLYTMPAFFALFLLCTTGDRVGRLAVCAIFFCLEMSVCAILDTYFGFFNSYDLYDFTVRAARPIIFGCLWLVLRRHLPENTVTLPRRLWKLVLGLAAMPMCALAAVVLLTYDKYDSPSIHSLAMNLGMVVLPFVFLTSLVLLFAIMILADHEQLEQANRMANLREVYYQGLQREEKQVRTLRHDLRNHLTVVQGLLETGDTTKTLDYLDQIAGSPALRGTKRFCENETANVVLASKSEEMARDGLDGDFAISLPRDLPIADTDLCALLGNALDNAMEAARQAADKHITVRCRAEKGLFMLRVENAVGAEVHPDLSTTKADKSAHGFGLAGMREIAQRYGGSLDAQANESRFELVACFPLR